MTFTAVQRPGPGEHAAHYTQYIDLVPGKAVDLADLLTAQLPETLGLLRGAAAKADYAYAPGKWTVKEVVGHLADTERVMSYRALRFGRGDRTEVPGFDEKLFVDGAHFGRLSLNDLVDEFQAVRAATVQLVRHLDPSAFELRGTANGHEITVRALFYVIAGHERHHRKILKERYFA